MAFALSPVLVLRGGSAAFLLGCYLASLLGVKLLVKKMISLGFPYPDSINAFHMAGVVLVTLTTQLSYTSCRSSTVTVTGGSESGHDPPRAQCGWATEAMEVLPIALLSGLSLITGPSPRGLAYGTPSLTMIHAHVPLFTYAYELFKQKRQMDSRSILAVLLACGGSAFCVQGELLLGLSIPVTVSSALLAASSATLRAVRGVWQEELTRRSRRSPMRVVLWSSVWCLFLSCIFMCYNDGLAAFRALGTASVELKLMFAGSMVASIGLNALSQAFLHEMIMPYQYLGIILLAIGTFVSKVDAHEKEAAPGPNLDDFLHRKPGQIERAVAGRRSGGTGPANTTAVCLYVNMAKLAEALRPPASSSGESRATTASGVPGSRLDSRASSITSNVLPSGTVELPTILPNVELPQLVEQTSRETSKTIDAPSPPRCSREASKSQVPEDPAEAEEIRSDPVSDSLTATVGLDRSPPAEASKGAVSSQPAKASRGVASSPDAALDVPSADSYRTEGGLTQLPRQKSEAKPMTRPERPNAGSRSATRASPERVAERKPESLLGGWRGGQWAFSMFTAKLKEGMIMHDHWALGTATSEAFVLYTILCT
eukprot:g21201.t1